MKYYYNKNGVPFIKIGKGQFISADKQVPYYWKKSYKYGTTLDSGFTDTQTMGALKKAWLGYKIALAKGEEENLIKYAKIILKLQKALGFPLEDFSHIGVTVTDMYIDKEINDY
ncbi:MAG: hypothetical protein ACPKQO_00310 [Nitrososphaeraceae archaeon]